MQTTKQEQVDTLLATLSREELLTLIEKIAQRLRQSSTHLNRSMGSGKVRFPEEADIDDALQEIRSQCREEIEESHK